VVDSAYGVLTANRFSLRLFGDGRTAIRGAMDVPRPDLGADVQPAGFVSSRRRARRYVAPYSYTDPYRGYVNPFPVPRPHRGFADLSDAFPALVRLYPSAMDLTTAQVGGLVGSRHLGP